MRVGLRQREGEKKPTRYYSKRQEQKVADATQGKRQVNSGATLFAKGDVSTDKVLIECKTKMSPSASISVKKEWIEKNRAEALFMGKPYEAVAIAFGPGEENYYIINEELFEKLLEVLQNEPSK